VKDEPNEQSGAAESALPSSVERVGWCMGEPGAGDRGAEHGIDAVERSMADLVEANRRKDAFLLALAHDVRSPVSAVEGAATVLRHWLEHRSDQEMDALPEVVDVLDLAVAEMQAVIADLLDAERLEHGAVQLVRTPVDLFDLVERTVRATGAGGIIDVDVPKVVVELDAGLTERILWNLLTNAVVYAAIESPVCVCAEEKADHVLIHVDDAGPGIPDDRKEEVFEPFHRSTHAGAGIGLYLVREFARLHGGDAWIEDVPGGGSSVRVVLRTR
jgi:signal transduction histidine kinase